MWVKSCALAKALRRCRCPHPSFVNQSVHRWVQLPAAVPLRAWALLVCRTRWGRLVKLVLCTKSEACDLHGSFGSQRAAFYLILNHTIYMLFLFCDYCLRCSNQLLREKDVAREQYTRDMMAVDALRDQVTSFPNPLMLRQYCIYVFCDCAECATIRGAGSHAEGT